MRCILRVRQKLLSFLCVSKAEDSNYTRVQGTTHRYPRSAMNDPRIESYTTSAVRLYTRIVYEHESGDYLIFGKLIRMIALVIRTFYIN